MTLRKFNTRLSTLLITACLPLASFAQKSGNNAWEKVLTDISNSLSGPVAYAMATIAIIVCGIIMAFADLQGGAKRFVQAALGLSIAFGAASIVSSFLGFSGALIG